MEESASSDPLCSSLIVRLAADFAPTKNLRYTKALAARASNKNPPTPTIPPIVPGDTVLLPLLPVGRELPLAALLVETVPGQPQ